MEAGHCSGGSKLRVYDFRLSEGGVPCSLILGSVSGTLIQVQDVTITLEQLEELYDRVVNFDEEATDEGA